MKIKTQSDEIIELQESDQWVLVLGLTLFILGACSLVISLLTSYNLWIAVGLFTILGTTFLVVRVKTIIIFDKNTSKITIQRKSLIQSHSEIHNFSEVKGVIFRIVPKPSFDKAINSNGRATSPIYLALVLSDDSYVHIGNTVWSSPNALFQPAGKSSWRSVVGQQIAVFLDVPYSEQTTSRSDFFEHTTLE